MSLCTALACLSSEAPPLLVRKDPLTEAHGRTAGGSLAARAAMDRGSVGLYLACLCLQ